MTVSSIDLVEAAYQTELPMNDWLRGLATAAEHQLENELGTLVMPYRIDEDFRISLTGYYGVASLRDLSPILRDMLPACPPDFVRNTFARHPCEVARSTGSAEIRAQTAAYYERLFVPFGVHDMFIVNGLDPTGHGVCIGAALGALGSLSRRRRVMWSRVAAHVAAAYRLRRAGDDGSEAILTPGGRVEHAADVAKSTRARDVLREAAAAIDRARTRRQRRDDETATEMWHALVAGRWTLIDRVERDGRRLFIARKNDPTVAPHHALTRRELQVVGYAALGHSNKLIGYELGLTPSTIADHLSSAAAKLGVTSRVALIELANAFGRSEMIATRD